MDEEPKISQQVHLISGDQKLFAIKNNTKLTDLGSCQHKLRISFVFSVSHHYML